MENIWTSTAVISDFNYVSDIPFIFSEAGYGDIRPWVLQNTATYQQKNATQKTKLPTSHPSIWATLLKPLMPECVWHFYKEISHNKIPVHSFIFIATKISFKFQKSILWKTVQVLDGPKSPVSACMLIR